MNEKTIRLDSDSLEQAIRFLRDLIDHANAGDMNAMSQLRESMKQCPSLIEKFGGDLADVAARSLVDAITGKQSVWKEAILQQMELMRVELAGANPSAIEKLLVDRVVTCWLQAQHADFLVARIEDVSLQAGDYLQRRQDRAHRRFLSAVKTLANVRRLALPLRVDLNVSGGVEAMSSEPAPSLLPRFRQGVLESN